MQYLKDEIRNRIISSALKEFYDVGFPGASMRQIAKNSGIAIGNMYRYFKNKEELFYAVVDPVFNSLSTIIIHHGFTPTGDGSIFEVVTEGIMPIFGEQRTQLLILIDKSKGTKYENVKDEFILSIEKEITKYLLPTINDRGVNVRDNYIFNLIAATFLEGLFIILRKYDDEESIKYFIHEFLLITFADIDKRFS